MSKPNVKKRSLEQPDLSSQPYRKKPRMTVFSYTNTDVFNLLDVSKTARKLDLTWMMSHAFEGGKLPMWVGYHAISCEDKLLKQQVRYMTNMRQPINSLDVIQETFFTTQRCVKECGQKFGSHI